MLLSFSKCMAVLLGVLCCGRACGLESVSVQLNKEVSLRAAGFIAAVEQGYYAEEGLDVELLFGGDYSTAIWPVLEEDVEFSYSGGNMLRAYMMDKPLVALAAISQGMESVLVVRRDSGILTPQDVVGKTIVAGVGYQNVEVLSMIREVGVGADEFTLIEPDPNMLRREIVDYLIDEKADGVIMRMTPRAMIRFSEANVIVHTMNPARYGHQVYENVIVTSQKIVQQRPEMVRSFFLATMRGWRYTVSHPREIIEICKAKYLSDDEQNEDMYNRLEYQMISILGSIGVDDIGSMTHERWQQIARDYVATGVSEKMVEVDAFIYDPNPAVQEAWVAWVVWIGGGVFFLALGVGVWNRQLSRRVMERTRMLQESEQHQKLMMKELDHRVKNNLASIISLSNKTLRASGSLEEYGESFNSRIRAIAQTHDALSSEHWEGIDLRNAARLVCEGHLLVGAGLGVEEVVELEGPGVTLPSVAAIPVTLALNELATNASKYGALSVEAGRVRLRWEISDGDLIKLVWEESGGPGVVEPIESGTGIGLIRGLIEYELYGKVVITGGELGLRCELEIPCEGAKAA